MSLEKIKQKCVWLGGFLASKFEIRENAPKLLPALQNLPDMFLSFNFGLRNSATLLFMAYVCRKKLVAHGFDTWFGRLGMLTSSFVYWHTWVWRAKNMHDMTHWLHTVPWFRRNGIVRYCKNNVYQQPLGDMSSQIRLEIKFWTQRKWVACLVAVSM